ncbi:MAG: DUF6502 family protein [Thiohalomonadaceae bacterium]
MPESLNKALTSAVLRILRPLVRVLLRHGVSFGTFADLAKAVFVDVAAKDFGIPGRKQTTSRISVLTGLTRKDVARLQGLGSPEDAVAERRYNRAARVVAGWVRDDRFSTEAGPRELAFEGASDSFSELVRAYSGDVPPRAIFDELERVGVAERTDGERVRLRMRAFVPQTGDEDKLHILGTDVAFLISTIDHNLQQKNGAPRFQRKVSYDNLPAEIVPLFHALSREKAQALIEEMDRWLSQHDRDINPNVKGTGRKQAGLGIYYFEEDVPEENSK